MVRVEGKGSMPRRRRRGSSASRAPGWRCALVTRSWTNTRHHNTKMLNLLLTQDECRLKLQLLPLQSPHLNLVERLWGVTDGHAAGDRLYLDIHRFAESIDAVLDETLPWTRERFRKRVTDSLRAVFPEMNCLVG